MIVPASATDNRLPPFNDDDDDEDGTDMTSLHHRMTQSDIVLRQPSELDHVTRPYRSNNSRLEDDENGCYFGDGILLPPSPFRSPEFAVEADAGRNGHVADTYRARMDGNSLSNNRSTSRRENDDGDRMLWMSSPDDVTPTNENQPQGFDQQQQPLPLKSPAMHQTSGNFAPGNMSAVSEAYTSRFSEL